LLVGAELSDGIGPLRGMAQRSGGIGSMGGLDRGSHVDIAAVHTRINIIA
jgi:hypothetical protein